MKRFFSPRDQNQILPKVRAAVREYAGIVTGELPGLKLDVSAAAYRSLLQQLVALDYCIESHGPHNSNAAVAYDESAGRWTVNYRRITAAVDTAYLQYAIHWAT